jgi:hypothetical protein
MSDTEKNALLDLADPRAIALIDRGRNFTLRCRSILPLDWSSYFSGTRMMAEQKGRDRVNTSDFITPLLALVGSVLTGAEGYKVAGGAELTSLDGWQDLVPMAHRLEAGKVLTSARPAAQDDSELVLDPQGETITIDATWGAVRAASGGWSMRRFEGLKHVLAVPSEAQHRRYLRQVTRAVVTGGSRGGRTVYPGANDVLAELYDELVRSVDGYAWEGKPLADSAQIVARMDMHHKVIVAQEIFEPQGATVALAEGE